MYVAHITDEGRRQTLEDHLKGVARYAKIFGKEIDFPEVCEIMGYAHDLGKYSKGFQDHILHNGPKVDHSTCGAVAIRNRYPRDIWVIPAAMCIAGHHAGLANFGTRADEAGSTYCARVVKCNDQKKNAYLAIAKEYFPKMQVISETTKGFEDDPFAFSALTRMLYSVLVDGDFLDTESFMQGKARDNKYDGLSDLSQKVFDVANKYLSFKSGKSSDTILSRAIGAARNQVLRACIDAGKADQGLFSLTVPTGGGKTFSSLAFAFSHIKAHPDIRRIIYVIPFTSIIEQTATKFREILGDKNVLEHSSSVVVSDDLDEQQIRKKLAAENWDIPVVVTTNEQFFESFYANRSSKCRKLHNIAHSIVIFDEVQMLPVDLYDACLSAITELVNHYHVTAVLCSATQPKIPEKFDTPHALVANFDELFETLQKCKFVDAGCVSLETLASAIKETPQCLCIVNTKKMAGAIYDALSSKDGTYYLTTNLTPIDRKKRLTEIRERLATGKPCRVVSTSMIEAGVDVDFPEVWRERTGLDSIFQAGGRCNREGKRSSSDSIVHVFTFDAETQCKNPSYVRQPLELFDGVCRKFNNDFDKVFSLEGIRAYFDDLYHRLGGDRNGFMEKFFYKGTQSQSLSYEDIASEFVLIRERKAQIVIPLDNEGKKLSESLKSGFVSRSLMRKLSPYIVTVYEYDLKKLMEKDALSRIEGYDDLFVLDRSEFYTEEKGLDVNAITGVGFYC